MSMSKSGLILILLSLILLVLTLSPKVYAEDENVNLGDLPSKLAERLGISEYAGKILATAIFILLFVMPAAFASKGNWIICLIVGLVSIGFAVAMGWLDFWFLLLICLTIASLWGSKIVRAISGGERE